MNVNRKHCTPAPSSTSTLRKSTSTLRKTIATLGVIGIVGGLLMAAPVAASAETAKPSWAEGNFLSGSLVGSDLAKLVELKSATAWNTGNESPREVVDPLAVSILGTAPMTIGSVRVNPDAVLHTDTQGGVLSQYARAEKNGVAMGASGAVGKGGAIGPNASAPGDAFTMGFEQLLNNSAKTVVSDLKLQIQTIAAQANGTADSYSGKYYLNSLKLRFTSPALAGLPKTVVNAVGTADSKLNSLTGSSGQLAVAVNTLLKAANPALSLTGQANVAVSIDVNLKAAIAHLLAQSYTGNGVSFDVSTGEVTVDLAALVGGDLNNRPANSELLTGATVKRVVATLSNNVNALTKQVVDQVKVALNSAKVAVDADLKILTDQAPVLTETCQYLDPNGNILGEVLGKLLGKLVCTTTTTVLPKLQTSASVHVHGTVAAVIAGTAPGTVTASVLGVPVAISTSSLLGSLGHILNGHIFGTNGVLSTFTQHVNGPLLAQANDGLLGRMSVTTVLDDLLSVKVNVQELKSGKAGTVGKVFTQTALRVAVAPGASDGAQLTTLSLASGSVGTAATGGGPIVTGDPGPREVSGSEVTQTLPTDTKNVTFAGEIGPNNLAYTGATIGALIALLLALLAAGAWLVREGYSRRQRSPIEQ